MVCFMGTSRYFSKVAAMQLELSDILTNNMKVIIALHPRQHLVFSFFLLLTLLMDV